MRKKINTRFIGITLFSIIVTTSVLTAVFYAQLRKQVFSDLETIVNLLIDEGSYEKKTDNIRISVIDSDGRVLFDSVVDEFSLENHADRPEIIKAKQTGEGQGARTSDTLSESIFYYAKLLDDGRILRIGKKASSVFSVLISTLPIALGTAFILACICLVVSGYLTEAIVKPINDMASDLDNIREDEGYPELIPFARKIRAQHEEILSNANMRQEFTANVTHELKTPLAAISGYAELMESGMGKEEDVRHFSSEIRKNAARLLTLINDIIKLSQLDLGGISDLTEVVNFADVAKESVEMLSLHASKNNVKLCYDGVDRADVRIGREMALEVTYNLIENAIRYNKPGGDVLVRVLDEGGKITFCVKDTGIGIPKEHQDRIFERFYRVDKGRSKELGGTGLGLAIVKHIVILTGGEIKLKSKLNQGTKVRITWNKI